MGKELGRDGGEAVEERFHVPHRSYIIRKEIAGLLSQRLRDADEILDVQPALLALQSGQVCGRHRHRFRYISLASTFRLAEMPQDPAIHV